MIARVAEARGGAHRLFREATQLKTDAPVIRATGIESRRQTIQTYAVSLTECGGPIVSVVADGYQRAQSAIVTCVAEARGGAHRLFREATQLKSVGTARRVAVVDSRRVEVQA